MEQLEEAIAKARARRSLGHVRGGIGDNSLAEATSPSVEAVRVPFSEEAFRTHKVVAHEAGHPVAEVYRTLQAQLLWRMAKNNKKTLAVTSPGTGDGKSLTATNLAISMAMNSTQPVVLVDLDLRTPALHQLFGIQPTATINDFLNGDASLGNCLVDPGLGRLWILPARATSHASELLASPQMLDFAKSCRGKFPDHMIIYDLPSLFAGDTIGFLPSVDAVLLVIRDGASDRSELKRAAQLLEDHDLVGTVLNAIS